MKRGKLSGVIVGLALFSMLFSASNFLLPIKLGVLAHGHWLAVFMGFSLTAIVLPLLAMITITLFDGDYVRFFSRLGIYTGPFLLLICVMLVIFCAAIPRIIWLCYAVAQPAMPFTTFALWYLFFNLLGAWYKDYLVWLLGLVVSPLLLIGLCVLIGSALIVPAVVQGTAHASFGIGALYGFATLDLLGMLFFGCVVLTALKRLVRYEAPAKIKWFVQAGLQGGAWCSTLFFVVYLGLMLLGSRHGYNLVGVSDGVFMQQIGLRLFGSAGAIWLAWLFFLTCYSTSVALTSVVAEYIQVTLLNNRISYRAALVAVHGALFGLSYYSFARMSTLIGPVLRVLYPVIIVLVLCNLGYALFGLRSIKVPVWLTFVGSLAWFVCSAVIG